LAKIEEIARKMDAKLERRIERKGSSVAQVLAGAGRTGPSRLVTTITWEPCECLHSLRMHKLKQHCRVVLTAET
jgi:hypothetical protein